jgi:hypothetical protein
MRTKGGGGDWHDRKTAPNGRGPYYRRDKT